MEILLIILPLYLISGVVIGLFCAYLAVQKEHSAGAWFVLGLLFSFLALLVLIGLPSEQRPPQEQGGAPGQPAGSPVGAGSAPRQPRSVRLCPHCIQEVHELASACPHCQRSLPEVEHCSYEHCGKTINPTDSRCEDDEGNPFCQESHRGVEHCSYKACDRVIEPSIDNRCEDNEGNPFCSKWHRDRQSTETPKLLQVQEQPKPAFFFPFPIALSVAVVVLVVASICAG